MPRVMFGPEQTVFQGKIFALVRRDVQFPDGTTDTFEFCKRRNSVLVLPFDDKGRLLLTHEFRHSHKKKTYFLPAGRVDSSREPPKKAARRELREETGFDAETLRLVRVNTPSDYFIWKTYVYAARDLFPSPLQGDEHFPIDIIPVPLKTVVTMALDGTIENEFIAYNIIRFHYMLTRGQFQW